MKNLVNYLDMMKEKSGSDYRTAEILGVNRAAVSQMRTRGQVSEENAVKIAKYLKIDPSEVMLAIAIARSDGEVKTVWEEISKKAGLAASILITLTLFFPASKVILPKVNNIHYAQSIKRHRKQKKLKSGLFLKLINLGFKIWQRKKATFTIPAAKSV